MVDRVATKFALPSGASGVTVKSGTILEEAAKTMTDANQQYTTVVGENGKPLDILT